MFLNKNKIMEICFLAHSNESSDLNGISFFFRVTKTD